MTNTLPLQEWLRIVKDEYLDGFVNEGGSSIKFAVPGRNDLSPLLKSRFSSMAGELGYLVVGVDAGQTRVHMLQEIFFRIAEQVDWRLLSRRVVLRLASEAGYRTDTVDIMADNPLLEEVSRASDVDGSMIGLELRNAVFKLVTQNASMSRDFRVAMTQLCLAEMGTGSQNQEAVPLVEWLTGVNRRMSNVRRYSIYNGIARTNARHFLESLLHWVRLVGYSGTCVILDSGRVPLRRNPHDGLRFYSRSAVMDHYELLRELIDSTDRLDGLLMVVLAGEEFLDDERGGKGFFIYQALRSRIADEVRPRSHGNPMATLVRLSDGPASETRE